MKNDLKHQETVCVIGLGYIGLPTAVTLATHGYRVTGVDVRKDVVDMVNKGQLHFVEPELDVLLTGAVASGRLSATQTPTQADCFILAVPTPIIEDTKQPDLAFVYAATEAVAPVLRPGNLIILESTSPVGTTEEIHRIIEKQRPDLVTGGKLSIDVSHCPERVLPGKIVRELIENDRIVGGTTPSATKRAADFYRTFVTGKVLETDARTAEMAKLTENAFRDVNIAFANELSLICERLGINVWELIKLANCHPRVNILNPGPGVGGHCIAVDPWFIVAAAPDEAKLMRQARLVNDGKSEWVINRIRDTVRSEGKKRVACLGLAFKADVDDLRESPAVHIVQALQADPDIELIVCEPMVGDVPKMFAGSANVKWVQDPRAAIEQADIVAMLTDHASFRVIAKPALAGKTVIDTRGFWEKS